MNEIRVNGTQKFMGINIPVIEGGFGDGCKRISDKTISEIHNMRNADVRIRITDNIKRFKENIDYIDLKQRACYISDLLNIGYAKQSITQANNIYLLSERGYAKLVNLMDDKKLIGSKFQQEYFNSETMILDLDDERKENTFFNKLSQILNMLNLYIKRQYYVDGYRIDGYISELNVAIEYDENNHKRYTYEQHEGRQKEIENELKCKFIRVSDKNSDEHNIGLILKELLHMNKST